MADSILEKSLHGAYQLLALQLFSRAITFTLNQVLLRFTSAATLGLAYIQFDLLIATVLFLSREGIRCALLRSTVQRDSLQRMVNVAYIPVVVGAVCSSVALMLYTTYPPADYASGVLHDAYTQAVWIYVCAAMVELLSEPAYIVTQSLLRYKLRTRAEGIALTLKAITTLGIVYVGERDPSTGILAFACAQLVYATSLLVVYALAYTMDAEIGLRQLLPSLNGLDMDKVWLAGRFTRQSFLKHLLTYGDYILVSVLSSMADQGVYAFVLNYGSLIVRIVFQPLEETARAFFAQLLVSKESSKEDRTLASKTILIALKFHLLLGHFFVCLFPFYTFLALDMLVGIKWSRESAAPAALAFYCLYVPIMGINGITEGFVQAVADTAYMAKLDRVLIVLAVVYTACGWYFVSVLHLGALGLIAANMVNLSGRIAWSWTFLQVYFGDTQAWKAVWPQWQVSAAALGVGVVSYSSSLTVHSLAEGGWRHLGLGVASGVFLLVVVWTFERAFLRQALHHFRRKG